MKQNFFLLEIHIGTNKKDHLEEEKKASQGDNYFVADNPPFGVEFTYFLKEKYSSKKSKKKERRKKIRKRRFRSHCS